MDVIFYYMIFAFIWCDEKQKRDKCLDAHLMETIILSDDILII